MIIKLLWGGGLPFVSDVRLCYSVCSGYIHSFYLWTLYLSLYKCLICKNFQNTLYKIIMVFHISDFSHHIINFRTTVPTGTKVTHHFIVPCKVVLQGLTAAAPTHSRCGKTDRPQEHTAVVSTQPQFISSTSRIFIISADLLAGWVVGSCDK